MKLSRTQQKLIDAARANGGRYCTTLAVGTGSQGGRVSAGWRDSEALRGLVDAGLVEVVTRSVDRDTRKGYTVTSHTTAFRLTGAAQ